MLLFIRIILLILILFFLYLFYFLYFSESSKEQNKKTFEEDYDNFFQKMMNKHKELTKTKKLFFLSKRQKHILFFINNFKKFDSTFRQNILSFSNIQKLFELSNNKNINSIFDKEIIDFILNNLNFSDNFFGNYYKKLRKSSKEIIVILENNNVKKEDFFLFTKNKKKLIDFKEKIKTKNIPEKDKDKLLENLNQIINNWDVSYHLQFVDFLYIVKNFSEKIEEYPNCWLHPEKMYMTCDGLVWILESKINLTKFERSVFIFLKKILEKDKEE